MKVNWREIIERNEEKVKDGIKRAYELACGGHFGNEYTSEIDTAGNVNCYEYVGGNSQSYQSWKGTAIEVARIKAFDPMDCEDFSYFPQDDAELTEEEKTTFTAWCKQNEEEPEPGLLNEWAPEVWQRWEKVYREEYIAAYADSYADEEYQYILDALEQEEKYAEL